MIVVELLIKQDVDWLLMTLFTALPLAIFLKEQHIGQGSGGVI